MIHTDVFHYSGKNPTKIVRSHRLQPREGTTIFCILTGDTESIVSILEDHILEALSSIEWNKETLDDDFSFISENFNHFIQNIEISDMQSVGVLLAVLIDEYLVFAHTGATHVLLIEQDGNITPLSNADTTKTEFHAISSGNILSGSQVYFSNVALEEIISEDTIRDLTQLNSAEWNTIMKDVFSKEIADTIHIGYISHKNTHSNAQGAGKRQADILRGGSRKFLGGLQIGEKISTMYRGIYGLIERRNKEAKYVFLAIGTSILFILIYLLFSAIFSMMNPAMGDAKNKLIEATELIENSQKLINNPASFNKNIQAAEKILFELRSKRVQMTDTQNLLNRIEAIKKEVNDIQTIDISKLNAVVSYTDGSIDPIGVFEYNKKLNLIGRTSAILGYVRGSSVPKATSYPAGEQAQEFDFTDEGGFYILTNQNHILGRRGEDIAYVTSNGKNEWNISPIISTFNGNIYLTSSGSESINRYKPGINGFSTYTTIVSNMGGHVVDMGIDGGIYALIDTGKIIRYIGGTLGDQKNITLNKIPGEYTIGKETPTKLFIKQNLSYIYILSGNNIWIFSPDSKRFQDVTAWNYVAQLELQATDDTVLNISVPRDGLIYVVTEKHVYELGFEIADGKIILR